MEKLQQIFRTVSKFVAPVALGMALITGNATCFYCTYQPEEPACLKNMRFHDLLVKK